MYEETTLRLSENHPPPPPPHMLRCASASSTDYLQKWFVAKHTGVDVDDVKEVVTTGSVETRAYFVAVDHSTRSVVLSIRGTFSLSDTVADLVCNPVGGYCEGAGEGAGYLCQRVP